MTDHLVEELADKARALEPGERSRLVDLILASLQEPELSEVEAAWAEELARRVAAHERGEVETFSADEVFAEARRMAP